MNGNSNGRATRAFTLVELLVVMAIIALLLGLLLPALAKARATARQVKDGTQIKQVHTACLTASNDSGGALPLPGEINRDGQVPGRGDFDERQNNHANLHGAMIGRGYLNAQILVSPAEVNGRVVVCATYNMNAINPAKDCYWDPIDQVGAGSGTLTNPATGFRCDLASQCNTSYAVMPLDPSLRRKSEWRNTGNSRFAVLGNRGPKAGSTTGNDFTDSKTLLIHGGLKEWDGNIGFNDDHVEYGRTFYPESVKNLNQTTCSGGPPDFAINGVSQDNIFKNDTGCQTGSKKNVDSLMQIQKKSANGTATGVTTIDAFDGADFVSWD